MEFKKAIFWHRRDIRIADNAGLHKALIASKRVIPVFIFDREILDKLPKDDARVSFIHSEITELKKVYQSLGSDLIVKYGDPKLLIPKLVQEQNVNAVLPTVIMSPMRGQETLIYLPS